MPDIALDDRFERLGEWTLPHFPEHRVAGKLTYSDRRVELELNEALTPIEGDVSVVDEQPSYPVLHGRSTKGELLSILHARRAGISLNFGAGGMRQPERVISSWLMVGAHVDQSEQYTKVRFVVPGLAAWLELTPVQHVMSTDAASGALVDSFIRQAIPAEITNVPTLDAQIEWGAGTTSKANPYQSIAIDVQGWLCIKPSTPKSIEWFFEQHGKLDSMLAFFAGTPMPPTSVSAYIRDYPIPISVLVALRTAKSCQIGRPDGFFFPRRAATLSLEKIVSNWFANIDSVLVPSQLATSTLSSKDLWLHVHFASLAQALEGYHRGRYPGIYMQAAEYEKVKSEISKAIPTTLPTDHKDALRSRIRYGNQISLSKRLSELANSLGIDLAKLVLGGQGKVPRTWVDTRNYHSHWDEELITNAISGQEMYNANIRMEHFIRTLFLLLAGIRPDEIVLAMGGISSTAQQLVQINIIDRYRVDPSQPKGIYMTINPKGEELPEIDKPDDAVSNSIVPPANH